MFTLFIKRHEFQKIHVERDLFESCFPKIEISIGSVQIIEWDKNTPIALQIDYKKRNPTNDLYDIVTETYRRKLRKGGMYDLDVACQRKVAYSNGQTRSWAKIATFYNKNLNGWVASTKAPIFDDMLWKTKRLTYKNKLIINW